MTPNGHRSSRNLHVEPLQTVHSTSQIAYNACMPRIPPRRPGPRPRFDADQQELIVQAYLDGALVTEIMRTFGCSKALVYKVLKRQGLQIYRAKNQAGQAQ